MAFGEKLKNRRDEKGLSQNELASLLGLTSSTIISNWEKGKNRPDIDKLEKLCEVLGCSPNYFFDYQEKPNGNTEQEELLLQKYRRLDAPGRQVVDSNIDMQLERCIIGNGDWETETAILSEPTIDEQVFLKVGDPEYEAMKGRYPELKEVRRNSYLPSNIILRLLWNKGFRDKISLFDVVLLERGVRIPSHKLYEAYYDILNSHQKQLI